MSCELVLEIEGDEAMALYPEAFIPAGSIGTAPLADGAVTPAKMDVTLAYVVDASGDLTITLT